MNEPIFITAMASISPLGTTAEAIWESYQNQKHYFAKQQFGEDLEWVAPLSDATKEALEQLRNSDPKYKNLDATVLYALYTSRKAVADAGWKSGDDFGINIGSSRGATALFEKYHEEFLQNKKSSTLSSPTTTLGNISSWVGHDLQTQGPAISHSITCSTALHAILNGVAWLKSGMTDKFLVGGSEAPLTPFTIAQMKALKIYSQEKTEYPCRAFDLKKDKNTMILGEAAAVFCLEKESANKPLAKIMGIGYATEALKHNISISSDAVCFQRSMKLALEQAKLETVDAIVMHAPGTIKGDLSEFNALKEVFCNKIPFLTTNKWKVGHTFGASGALSMELAVLMLQRQQAIKVPFVKYGAMPKEIKSILVNAVGFGGNAVSILLTK